MPSLSQVYFRDYVSRFLYGSIVCYSFGISTLVRAELDSEARLIGFRFESRSLRTKQCSVFELSTASPLATS